MAYYRAPMNWEDEIASIVSRLSGELFADGAADPGRAPAPASHHPFPSCQGGPASVKLKASVQDASVSAERAEPT